MSGPLLLHASCVAFEGKGVLILGPSGRGKSDLALRLIDQGARLVSDDQVALSCAAGEDRLVARAPETIKGLIEARGLGICRLEPLEKAAVGLAVSLLAPEEEEVRLPEEEQISFLGCSVPLLRLHGGFASTPVKIKMFLFHVVLKT